MADEATVLLVYGTTEGQTEKIATFVADRLAKLGRPAKLVSANQVSGIDPGAYGAVVVAASLHAGRYQSSVIHFVRTHRAQIDAKPNAFLSVSLAAAGDSEDIKGLKRCVDNFVHETGWTPRLLHHAAGAFRYTDYDFFKRWAMKYIAYRKGAPTDTSRDHELTDWDDIARFVDGFVQTHPLSRAAS